MPKPEAWTIRSLIDLASYTNGLAFKPRDWSEEGTPIIRIEQLNDPEGEYDYFRGTFPDKVAISNGDLIFSWSATLKVAIWRHGSAVLNQHLFKVVPKLDVDKLYLLHLLDFHMDDLAGGSQGSTMRHIKRGELRTFEVAVPSQKCEQARIGNILTTVDNQIEKTEALIVKYQSIKQGLMHDLFTRGVDEHGRLRPSRDEAPQLYKESEVGFIPGSWSVEALESLVAAGSSITYGVVQPGPEDDQGIRFVRGGDVYDGEINIGQLRTISKAISATYRRTLLRGGELVMSLVGYPGEVAVIPAELRDANIARQVALIRLDEEVVASFVMEYLLSSIGKTRLFEKQNGSAQQVINLADLKFVQVTLPLRDEQTAIANHLRAARNHVESEKSHLAKLRHIKLGLMQDLLTGKVSVQPQPDDQYSGITPNGTAKAGVKSRGEGIHA